MNISLGSQPLKLRDIVNEWKIFAKNFDILPVYNMRTDYSSISSSGNEVKTQMGRMTLEDTYDEMFLLAHPLFDGNNFKNSAKLFLSIQN